MVRATRSAALKAFVAGALLMSVVAVTTPSATTATTATGATAAARTTAAPASEPTAPTYFEAIADLFSGNVPETEALHDLRSQQLEHYAEGRLQEMRRKGCPTTAYGAARKALAALDRHYGKIIEDWANAALHDHAAMAAIAAKSAVLAGKITVGVGAVAIAAGVLPALSAGALIPEAVIVAMGGIQNVATFSSLAITLTEYARSLYDIVVNGSSADGWKAMSDLGKRFIDAMKSLNGMDGFYSQAMKDFLGSTAWASLKVGLDALNAIVNPMDDFSKLYEARNDWQERMVANGYLYNQLLKRLDDAYKAMIKSDRDCEEHPPSTTTPTTAPACQPGDGRPCVVRPPGERDTVIVRVVVKVPGTVTLEFRWCDGLTCGNTENADCVSNLWIPNFADRLPPRIVLVPPAPGMRLEKLFLKGQDDGGVTNHYGYYDASQPGDWNRNILERAPAESGNGTVTVDLKGSGIVQSGLKPGLRPDGRVCGITDEQKKHFTSKYGDSFRTPDTTYLATAIWGREGPGHAKPGGTTNDTTVPIDRTRREVSTF